MPPARRERKGAAAGRAAAPVAEQRRGQIVPEPAAGGIAGLTGLIAALAPGCGAVGALGAGAAALVPQFPICLVTTSGLAAGAARVTSTERVQRPLLVVSDTKL